MKARLGIALVLSAALLAPAVGHAAWSADPVTIHATSDHCPLVAAASDAQDGAIVVWQQDDAANPGVYRLVAKRVLAGGDLDPTWPAAGLLVSSATVNRAALGAVGDWSGGAYVWWIETATLYLTRVLSDGTIASGWPARGKGLGSLMVSAFRPLVIADGQGGIWLGWLGGEPLHTLGHVAHLGPDGLGANGWPAGGRGYAPSTTSDDGGLATLAFTYAPVPGGGAWIAWGDAPYDSAGYHAGSWRLKRVTPAGLTAPGWDGAGLAVRDFHGELLVDVLPYYWPCEPPYLAASPVAVAADGAGGAYLLLSDVDGGEATPKLFHRDSTGSPDPSWPAAGVTPYQSGGREAVDYGADWSLRLFPEVAGGVFALLPCYYSEGFSEVDLFRFAPAGTYSGWTAAWGDGLESLVPPTGETWFATYFPHGPMSPFSPDAFLHLDQTAASGASGPGFTESHDQAAVAWYGDIGLAPTSNAGAIFAWSQEHERFGIFARRFAPGGQVTAVEPAIAPARALRLRFAPGRGVVVTPGRVAGGRVLLYDLAGRVCAGADVAAGEHEVTIEGTAALASGIYFARHRGSDGAIETGRVVVIR